MKKKLFYYLSIILLSLSLAYNLYSIISYEAFDSDSVIYTIKEFSSDKYKGRLPGTIENATVADNIEAIFKKNGLLPLNSTYKEGFKLDCPTKTNSQAYLNIIKDDKTITSLEYGLDFKEDGINFNKNTINFSNDDILKITAFTIQVSNSYGNFLFFTPSNDDLMFRSSFSNDFPFDCVIMITSKTYGEIIRSLNNDYNISLHIPFKNEVKEVFNVSGILKGKDSSLPPIVLTAHFDHLGKDGLGNIYSGALDNASGISFLLELQSNLSSLGTPNRDIIFVALNAEEFGLKGSEIFARNNLKLLSGSEIINFDMIGSLNYPLNVMLPLSMENQPSSLYEDILSICTKRNIDITFEYKDSSDHASFGNLGISALTLSHSDMRFIHTPNDTIENIDKSAIDSVYGVVYKKIVNDCYGYTSLIFKSKYLAILLSTLLLSLIAIPIYKNHFKLKE